VLCGVDSSACQHSSVDGVYYYFETNELDKTELNLFFVEFKHINQGSDNYHEKIAEFKHELKIKPFETVFCILPHLIDKYCEEKGIQGESNKMKLCLCKCKKHYYCVIPDSFSPNQSNSYINISQDLIDINQLEKYPFDSARITSPIAFEKIINEKFSFM